MSWIYRNIPIYPIKSRVHKGVAGDINYGNQRVRVPMQANADLMVERAKRMIDSELDTGPFDRWLRMPLL